MLEELYVNNLFMILQQNGSKTFKNILVYSESKVFIYRAYKKSKLLRLSIQSMLNNFYSVHVRHIGRIQIYKYLKPYSEPVANRKKILLTTCDNSVESG